MKHNKTNSQMGRMGYISLLRATGEDGSSILSWRNDPAICSNFFSPERVSSAEHERWYKAMLRDKNTAIYVAWRGNERIGVIRFEKKMAVVSISVNVAPHLIGKGFGSEIIRLGTERYYAETKQKAPIIAKIQRKNIASQKAFRNAGYKKKAEDNEKVIYIRKAEDLYVRNGEICLRPLGKEHINKRYLKWLNDPDVTKYLETKKSTEKELKTYYQHTLDSINAIVFAIEVGKKHIGNAKLEINWKHAYASFGIMIGDKRCWGKGYGSKVARIMAGYAFNRLGLYAVTLGVYGNHTAAIHAYEKAGFCIKGCIQDMLNFEGNRVDKVIMGVTSTDFKHARQDKIK